jgi:hypothetical protein
MMSWVRRGIGDGCSGVMVQQQEQGAREIVSPVATHGHYC